MLIPSDYNFQIRQEVKAMLLKKKSATTLSQAEKSAKEQMKSYLLKRYDTDRVFIQIEGYNPNRLYAAGEFCYYVPEGQEEAEAVVYECKYECQGLDPLEADFWQKNDPRSPLLVMYLIDMTLYHLYSSTPSQQMPTGRGDRYEDALEWLKDIRDGKIEAMLPKKTEPENTAFDFRFGSHPKRSFRF